MTSNAGRWGTCWWGARCATDSRLLLRIAPHPPWRRTNHAQTGPTQQLVRGFDGLGNPAVIPEVFIMFDNGGPQGCAGVEEMPGWDSTGWTSARTMTLVAGEWDLGFPGNRPISCSSRQPAPMPAA
jgi:hypothetical protein